MTMELLTRKDALSIGAKYYFTGKPCRNGHLSKRQVKTYKCLECHRLRESQRFIDNRDEHLARQREQRAIARQDPEWRANKYANDKKSDQKFFKKHGVSRSAMRRHRSPAAKMAHAFRVRVRQVIRLESQLKSSDALLGCTHDQLVQHLESQFLPGMSWNNYGDWHVDHIRPCASFDLLDPEQQARCFHYTNLQPLWAKDNISKGAKYEPA